MERGGGVLELVLLLQGRPYTREEYTSGGKLSLVALVTR